MLAPLPSLARLVGLAGLLFLGGAAASCGGDSAERGAPTDPDGGVDGSGPGGGGQGGADGGGGSGSTAYEVFTATGTGESSDEAFAIGRAAGGKLIVAGTCGGGPRSEENPFATAATYCVIRLAADGRLDTTFGAGGRVVLPLGWGARKLAIQSDGRIVLVGNAVGRLLADGAIDTSFGGGDGLVEDQGAVNLALQADGKIVVTGARNGLARTTRYLPDGTPDATFGAGGVVQSDVTPQNDFGTAVTIQADGKIVVAGVGAVGAGQRRFILLRYLADGSPDSTFDGDGQVVSSFKGDDLARDVVVDEDQRIVVVGIGYPADSIVARYTSAGALDTTFNGTGYRLTAADSSFEAVATQAGTITCGGYGVIRRYTATGAPDATFDGTGRVEAEIRGEDMALLDDGSVVLVGQRSGVTSDLSAVKYTPAGVVDTTFGENGFVDVDGGARFDVATSVLPAEDGSVIIAGESSYRAHFVKIGPTGALDPTFGDGGIAGFTDFYIVRGLARQASGKLVFAAWGQPNVSFVVGRLDPNGALDKTFGSMNNGLVRVPHSGSAMGRGIVTDGSSIWAVGGTVLAKLGVDGELDKSFGNKEGMLDPAVPSAGGITRQADGKLVVWSTSPLLPGKVVRFDPTTGARDETLGGTTGLTGPDGFAAAHVAAQPDGKLLVTWIDAERTTLRLERRGADGTLDPGFGQGGVVTETLAPATPRLAERPSSVPLDDGRIALVTSESDDIVVFLYEASGVRANSFGQGGRLSVRRAGAQLAVRAPAAAVGGTLFLAGSGQVGPANAEFVLGRVRL